MTFIVEKWMMAHVAYCSLTALPWCPLIEKHLDILSYIMSLIYDSNLQLDPTWPGLVSVRSKQDFQEHLITSLKKTKKCFFTSDKRLPYSSDFSSFIIHVCLCDRIFKSQILGLIFFFFGDNVRRFYFLISNIACWCLPYEKYL